MRCDKQITLLESAVVHGTEFAFGRLIEAGADLQDTCSDGLSIMHAAAKHGWLPGIQMLLDAGVPPIAADGSLESLEAAARYGHADCLRALLDAAGPAASVFAKADYEEAFAALAASNGHPDCLQVLLDFGLNPDAQYEEDRTLLHIAARSGHTECAQLLAKKVSNVDAADFNGDTPLHLAS